MIFHPILALLTATLNGLFALLPAWTTPGFGTPASDGALPSASVDGGGLRWFLSLLHVLDRFMPIHDALIPIVGVSIALALALLAFKAVKFFLSLIPSISAGG